MLVGSEELKHQLIGRDTEEEKVNQHFHVLAVDDSIIERKMLEKLLTISSYHVTCVESGDKALEYLGLVDNRSEHHDEDDVTTVDLSLPTVDHHEGQETRVNLIMTDYSMPGISGYDLLKRVKGSSWKDVPVVVMSSENVPSRIHMCLEEGAQDFLLKPVGLSDLKKLQPHILKSTCTKEYGGKNKSSNVGEIMCNFIANDNDSCSSDKEYEVETRVDYYIGNFDKGKEKMDGEQIGIRLQSERLTAV